MAFRYQGKLYRALHPAYAHEPLSGEGSARYGGRFNPKGTPALYCALTPSTALREANQVGDLQPTMLVSYDADIEDVFDSRDGARLQTFGMDAAPLADPAWRDAMKAAGQARTQAFARQLIGEGYSALLVRSFARGADEGDLNLVLWTWASAGALLALIDNERRLSR